MCLASTETPEDTFSHGVAQYVFLQRVGVISNAGAKQSGPRVRDIRDDTTPILINNFELIPLLLGVIYDAAFIIRKSKNVLTNVLHDNSQADYIL